MGGAASQANRIDTSASQAGGIRVVRVGQDLRDVAVRVVGVVKIEQNTMATL